MDREQIISQFLQDNGYSNYKRIKIPGDASFRHYERLEHPEHGTFILMDAPPATEDVKPFLKVDNILQKLKLSAPKIFAMDVTNGLLVLEDFGQARFANIFNEMPSLQPKLYRQALDVLAAIRNRGGDYDLPDYSIDVLIKESMLFAEWYLPLFKDIKGKELERIKLKFRNVLADALLKLDNTKKVLVLRDYHSENLMHLPAREGEQRVGLLDFQDALIGHPAYDIVSLLDDARRDVPRDLMQELMGYYFDLFPGIDREKFNEDYAILGAQRNLKIIGIFSRLKMRDGKEHYLSLIPRVQAYLMGNLQHPSLLNLKNFLIEECNL
jgi:aminoglycoside/choline kinase family phosphotransferase